MKQITNTELIEIEQDLTNKVCRSKKDVYEDVILKNKLLSMGEVFKIEDVTISNLGLVDYEVDNTLLIIVDLKVFRFGISRLFYIKLAFNCKSIEDLKYQILEHFKTL